MSPLHTHVLPPAFPWTKDSSDVEKIVVKGNLSKVAFCIPTCHRADVQIKRILAPKPFFSLFSSRLAPAPNNWLFFLRNALWDLTHGRTSRVRLLTFNHLLGKQKKVFQSLGLDPKQNQINLLNYIFLPKGVHTWLVFSCSGGVESLLNGLMCRI